MAVYTFDEYMNLKKDLLVPKKKQFGYTGVCKCGKKLSERWNLTTQKGIYRVSTIHLEIASISNDMNIMDDPEGSYWYETMIFNDKEDRVLSFQARYKTRQEAIVGHDLAVRNLKRIVERPDKYPRHIVSQLGDLLGVNKFDKQS